jgi:hypothetical protein
LQPLSDGENPKPTVEKRNWYDAKKKQMIGIVPVPMRAYCRPKKITFNGMDNF